jgi:hypothetical protein
MSIVKEWRLALIPRDCFVPDDCKLGLTFSGHYIRAETANDAYWELADRVGSAVLGCYLIDVRLWKEVPVIG